MGPEELATIQELPGSKLIGRPGFSLLPQAAGMKALPSLEAKSFATNRQTFYFLECSGL